MGLGDVSLGSALRFFSQFEVSRSPACSGVVTAADSAYFPGLQLLVVSLGGFVDVCVFDLGLDAVQLAWLAEWKVGVLRLPETHVLVPRNVSMWQTWNKPVFLLASPFRKSLWLDADCLVVGDVGVIFERLSSGPVVVAQAECCRQQSRNPDELYWGMPVPSRWPIDAVQAGLVCVDALRDLRLLQRWLFCVSQVWGNAWPATTACWDQGALLWACESFGLSGGLVREPGWGRLVMGGDVVRDGSLTLFLEALRVQASDVVLHFIDRVKYWDGWGCFLSN